MADPAALDWDRDGRHWPNREASRFLRAGGIGWHVQQIGSGPAALLLHGTGASTHSWAGLVPHLASRFSLIMPDLPGHGFTEALPSAKMTLPGMADAVSALLTELGVRPQIAIGHSAGAAILARMTLDKSIAPAQILAVNGALMPFKGAASRLFPAAAKLLFASPMSARFFAWRAAQPGAVRRLMENTGSHIPEQSLAIYERLFGSLTHLSGALAMMANWDLNALCEALPGLPARLVLMVGSNDRAIAPDDAFELSKRVPSATVELFRGLGHLMHEEDPGSVAQAMLKLLEPTCVRRSEPVALPETRPLPEQALPSSAFIGSARPCGKDGGKN